MQLSDMQNYDTVTPWLVIFCSWTRELHLLSTFVLNLNFLFISFVSLDFKPWRHPRTSNDMLTLTSTLRIWPLDYKMLLLLNTCELSMPFPSQYRNTITHAHGVWYFNAVTLNSSFCFRMLSAPDALSAPIVRAFFGRYGGFIVWALCKLL